jgi:predicted tellurium resistance membrane protein TerC
MIAPMHMPAGLTFDASAPAALVSLTVMEVVLGVDNLVFVAVLSNTLPEQIRAKARTTGLVLALALRIGLLSMLVVLTHLTQPVVQAFGRGFSVRDLILIAGGLFLLWKATTEIRHAVEPGEGAESAAARPQRTGPLAFAIAILQILLLDIVFSVDSILTAVGMTDRLPVMITAVLLAVGAMIVASGPLAAFIRRNPSVVMLALGFLLMIGAILIADGFGEHIPRGYIYAAMAFAAFVEILNMMARRKRKGTR